MKSNAIIAERHLRRCGALAQLVARYIRIVEVSGSNPLCSTNSLKQGIKTVLQVFCFQASYDEGQDEHLRIPVRVDIAAQIRKIYDLTGFSLALEDGLW